MSPGSSVLFDSASGAGGLPAGGGSGREAAGNTGGAGGGGGGGGSGGVRAVWKRDDAVAGCERCSAPFTFYRRRHHCRRCGGIFCLDCAKDKMPGISGWSGAERICRICQTLAPATSLAAQPRERTVVLLGSPGVGTSAIAQLYGAVGASAPAIDAGTAAPQGPNSAGPSGNAGASVAPGSSSAARRLFRHRAGGGDYVLALQDAIGHTHVGSFPPALAIAADIFLLVFSVDDHASLIALRTIYARILDCGCHYVPIVVVGTTRGESRAVPHEDCAAVAAELGAKYLEIAVTHSDVTTLFERSLDLVAARD
jgi:hypothetical protein